MNFLMTPEVKKQVPEELFCVGCVRRGKFIPLGTYTSLPKAVAAIRRSEPYFSLTLFTVKYKLDKLELDKD